MATAKEAAKKELQDLPGWSRGVRENAAVRMLKLARPICPNSKIEMEWNETSGKYVPREADPMRPNCQLRDEPQWWNYCEAQGHHPYYSERVWYTKQDVYEEDEETGEQVMVKQRKIRHVTKYPNFAQVAVSIRVNSGRGAVNAMERKGFKRVGELGFKEVCQFRNCQKPVSSKAKSTEFGHFCSPYHLQLVAADQQGIFLEYETGSSLQSGIEAQVAKRRKKSLREAAAFAADGD